MLSGVRLKDQGRYKCYTSTRTRNAESFVNVQVEGRCDRVIERNSIKKKKNPQRNLLERESSV